MRTGVHRSVLVLTAVLVSAAPASAAEVARTEGVRLDARDASRTELCLRLTETGSESGGGSGTCGRSPWRPRRSTLISVLNGDRVLAAGAVPASVTRAEAELSDGRRVAFDTVAGPGYRGRQAGKLRFFLAPLPVSDPADDEAGGLVAVRFFGEDGALEGIAASDRLGTPVGRRRMLLRERARGRSITVVGETVRRVASTPLVLDRFEEHTCLAVSSRARYGSTGATTMCHEPGPNRPALLVFPEAGCGPLRTVLAGFVGDAVTAVRLELGSGRVRMVRTLTLRDPGGGAHRYLATVVPRGEAVRSITAVGARTGYELKEPPSGLPCLDAEGGYAFLALFGDPQDGTPRPPSGDEQVAAEAGGHRLVVRDAEADRLCAGVDRLLADGSDCGLPAVNAEDAYGVAASGMVAAALPAEVARVRLQDGREVPTIAGGYGGRYAGAIRFLFVEGGPTVEGRLRMLDASGAVIGTLSVLSPELLSPRLITRPVRLAAGHGWRLTAAKYRGGACILLTPRGEEPECDHVGLRGDGTFASVGCTPRVAVLAGTLARDTRTVRAVLRGGRTLRARIVRIPRRLGRGRAWVLALPRGAGVTALRFDDRRARFPLLPAADQCGYRVTLPSFGAAEPELQLEPR